VSLFACVLVYVCAWLTLCDASELSKWHVDNLMTHLAALSLIVDEYQTDTYDLREDLGLKPLQ